MAINLLIHRVSKSSPMMMKLAILFALVAAAAAGSISRFNPLKSTGRIVGGQPTTIDEIPYQVSVQIFGSHYCGGSIISESWILTAAHCMLWNINWYTVRSGTEVSNSGGAITRIARIINHEGYATDDLGIPTHDIGMIQLAFPLTFSAKQVPIGLYETGQEAISGSPAIITGWGALTEGGSAPAILQSVTIPIVSKADCNDAYVGSGGLPIGQICAGVPEGGLDSCQGDSGGPLAINGVLAGVVSWGWGCARPGFPGVYSEVAFYRSWIKAHSGV